MGRLYEERRVADGSVRVRRFGWPGLLCLAIGEGAGRRACWVAFGRFGLQLAGEEEVHNGHVSLPSGSWSRVFPLGGDVALGCSWEGRR